MLTNLWFDLKYAWRLFFKTPAYSVLSVVVVAISVGLATFNYVMDYNIALKPLPYPGADRWYSVQIADKAAEDAHAQVDAYTYQEMLKRGPGVNHLGAFASGGAVLSEGQASTALRAAWISPALLSAMQVPPFLGRIFDAGDSQVGATRVAVLSYSAWQTFFAGDRSIIGKATRVDGQPVEIVGVMPKDFLAFQDFELWQPLQLPTLPKPDESAKSVSPLIVLGPDQSVESVLAGLRTAVDQVNKDYPKLFDAGRHVELFPAFRIFTHDNVPIIAISMSITGAILLLGSVNIAVVFFARFLERSHEMALKSALGAGRSRLLRGCLLESLFTIVAGLLIGLAIGYAGVHWGQSLGDMHQQIENSGRPATYPVIRLTDVLLATSLAVVLWLASTLFPGWRIANQDAAVELGGSGKGASGPRSSRSMMVLVGVQVVVASLVMVICANVVVAVRGEASKPSGVDTANVMLSTYNTTLPQDRYSATDQRQRYWEGLTERIRAQIPGSEVAYATAVPTDPESIPAAVEHQDGTDGGGPQKLPFATVSDGYFGLLGIKLRLGRLFDATDDSTSQNVAVVDENTARRYWGQEDVIGKRVRLNPESNGPWLTIVGVVSAVNRPYSGMIGVIYRPLRQAIPQSFLVLVKLPNAAAENRARIQAAAFEIDRDLPLRNLQKLDDYMRVLNLSTTALVPPFTAVTLITVLLAASGLFGLISRSVLRRTQEVGIRRALGGTQWQVTAVLMRPALWYLLVAVVGVCLGLLVANMLSAAIPNIFSHGILVTFTIFVIVAAVIFVSAYAPTRSTVALEPGDALHYE